MRVVGKCDLLAFSNSAGGSLGASKEAIDAFVDCRFGLLAGVG